ncbi:MAG: inositol oxygenase family protein [Pirellulaceae bacterium]|nr:inositol oxygenase family protein [Pirellulaceae bacterium]
MVSSNGRNDEQPLDDLHEWEDDLLRRYPEPEQVGKSSQFTNAEKKQNEFRDYEKEARHSVREFYRLNHLYQTVDFVRAKREEFLSLNQRRMGVWKGLEYLNTLVDDSDPDTDLSQIQHLLQTSEAIRADGHPRWFILAGLIHDLGKVLCLWDEPQWAVVGDTFPVGCKFSEKIVYSEFFQDNPDYQNEEYQSEFGIYEAGCGFENLLMSWGHDEYIYHVTKAYLPTEAQYILRYHSFYSAHREGEYGRFMNEQDREYFHWVKEFNPYDLYTKSTEPPNVEQLKPYYQDLIGEFFPADIAW